MATPLPDGPRTGGCLIRALFIEDDSADVELSLRELRKAWFDVQGDVVQTPEELAERMRAKSYDLALVDYRLPGWTGLDALDLLRAEGSELPVILLTGGTGEEAAVECLKRGAIEYVLKNHLERLPVAVRRALEDKSLREARRRAEEALRLSEASKRSLIEHATYGIGRASLTRDRFLEVNPALVAMLGCESEAEVLGLSLTRDVALDPTAIEGLFRSAIDAELDWKSKDGAPITVRFAGRAIRDRSGTPVEVEFVAENITARRQAERRIAQLNRLYAVSCEIGQAIVRLRDRDELFQEVCRIAVEKGLFRMAWIGLVDEQTGTLRPVAQAGFVDGYLERIRVSVAVAAEERGPSGTAARQGARSICDDIRIDPRMAPWREEALKRGYRSSGGFPIRVGGRSIGAISLYASEPGLFDQENLELLDRLVADVSFALESMEAEHRRKRAEEELEQFFQLSLDLLCIAGFDGRAKRMNPAWERTLGRPLKELEGRRLFRLVHPGDRRAAMGEFRKLMAGASTTWFEMRVRTQEGSYRWLVCNATPMPERGLIYAVARDATEQRQAQSALARLASIVEASDDAIVSMSLDGVVATCNAGAERIFGYSAQEVVGRSVSLLYPKDRLEELQRLLARVRRGDGVRNYEAVRVRKDGRRISVSITVSPIRNGGGTVIGACIISRDITAHKRLENQLLAKNKELEQQNRRVREASRVKNEFLANMSHELRSPLNGVIGFTELMHDGKLGPVSVEHQEYLGDILSSAKHLLQLINDMLDLAKVESGRIEFRPEPVALVKLVREVADVLRAIAAQKRIALEADVPPELNAALLDPARFKQVLYNYLSNALKFTPEDGRVRVQIRPEGAGEFRLEVEDNGIGIAAGEIPNLFTEFRQLDTSAAKKYQGSGLGLALTKRIVEAQGGRVGVDSQPGQGSVFFAVLPRVAHSAPQLKECSVAADA
ncbi:MAG: PAS domain S-box protein [Bryobacteraceae bacterium]|jgi:PAS domain S-box-containing protein